MGSVGGVMKIEIALRRSWWASAIFRRCAQCLVGIGELERVYISTTLLAKTLAEKKFVTNAEW